MIGARDIRSNAAPRAIPPMATITRRIGLSLGADLCWPRCYEQLLERLDLSLEIGGDSVSFEVERVPIEPFDLKAPCRYDVVLDRLTHWYHPRREWIKKSVLMDGLYVLNNPWAIQSMEKQTTYAAMMGLGLPVPDTWLVPPKEYDASPDLQPTLERYAKLFDLGDIGKKLGYPLFMKPYDGGAWVAVTRIDDEQALRDAYDASGRRVMHLQAAVENFDMFVRCLAVGPQVRFIDYDASAPLHDRYRPKEGILTDEERTRLSEMTLTINSFFGWDFNSCEVLRRDGVFFPIDFANACPDSQVTSLHYHFPWLVSALLRWSIFCAATDRPMRRNLDWDPFFAARDAADDPREALSRYGDIARERLDAERFDEFCDKHLAHLDEVAWEYFASDDARRAIRAKVEAMYPVDEHDEFTELFWGRIQDWRVREDSASASS